MTSRLEHTSTNREIHDFLVRRCEEAYEAWTRQVAVARAIRSEVDAAAGDQAALASGRAQLDEQDALAKELRRQLDDLSVAVERSQQGRYGRCDDCDAMIPGDRLEIFPAAGRCVACEQRRDDR
jgi:DnaK suppressor protein